MANDQVREPKQKRAIEKKQKIIKAATECFSTKGYENSSVSEIAKKAEVSVGIVYSYFKDKKGIFLAILVNETNNIINYLEEFIVKADNKSNDLEDFIIYLIDVLIKFHKDNRQIQTDIEILRKNDEYIEKCWSSIEDEIVNRLVYYLEVKKQNIVNPYEKINIAYLLVENLCHETIIHQKDKVNLDILKQETINVIINLLC